MQPEKVLTLAFKVGGFMFVYDHALQACRHVFKITQLNTEKYVCVCICVHECVYISVNDKSITK